MEILLNFSFLIFSEPFNYFIYFWETETETETEYEWGGAEREGDTESEAGSKLWAVSTEPDAGLELVNREILTWAKVGRLTEWATPAPLYLIFLRMNPLTSHNWQVLVLGSHSTTRGPGNIILLYAQKADS